MHEIKQYRDTELTEDVAWAIARLAFQSCKESTKTVEDRFRAMMDGVGSTLPEHTTGLRYAIWQDDRMVAHARTFVREMLIDDQSLTVLALATVCSDPDMRGQGLGAAVTRQAFQIIDDPAWPDVCLFQTPAAGFYEKLECRKVPNRFVNRKDEKDPEAWPWHDDTVMIYPAAYAWPEGVVDLNGPSY